MKTGFKNELSELAWKLYKLDPMHNLNFLRLFVVLDNPTELENTFQEEDELER